MTFPGPYDTVYYNEAGEPIGWDAPVDPSDFYCNDCGCIHTGPCRYMDEDFDEVEYDE